MFHRRRFLANATLAAGGLLAPFSASGRADSSRLANARCRIGSIGLKYQGLVIAEQARAHGDLVALCDVDRNILEETNSRLGGTSKLYEDYRDLLARDDIDVVTIGTPDHWHTAMVIDACRAGKDVYCEKPLTLTIDEGKQLQRVVRGTGRIVQVGSWQRSDRHFRLACELVRAGRIGKVQKVTVVLGKNKTGGPFRAQVAPSHFNWNLWQGQTPDVPYIPERTHYTFRWWYEYSGGQLTDWGAHHLDIAQWGIGEEQSGPVEITGQATFPQVADGYNVPVDFRVVYRYASGVQMEVLDSGRNGIMFEGDAGRLFVNRGTIAGAPVEELQRRPFDRGDYRLYAFDVPDRPERTGKLDAIVNHMANFFDCVSSRQTPISDVVTQHRSVSTCHLGNIAIRLGRTLRWNPVREEFEGDQEANTWLVREQRHGFEIRV